MAGPHGGMYGHPHGGAMHGQAFAQLDTNKDGKISKDEMNAFFDRVDTNKDGVLSQDELAAARTQFAQHRPRIDANGDGSVSRDEAKASPRLSQNFDAIDTNKDGSLSREEMQSWHRAQRSAAAQAPAVKP
jgi:Ca2+-binding EF-hand superfamily protein